MAINKAKSLAAADKYIARQNFSKALNELLKVAKVSPGDTNLLNKIGDLYSKVGNKKSAISYFLKVADSYRKSGFNLKAIALYKKIIRIDGQYMDARDKLVELYLAQGHNSEAKGELRRIAEHYNNERLFARALTCYEKMLEIDPNNLDARLKITEMLVREGRRDEAAEHFYKMAQELLNKNMLNEAQKMVAQGVKMDPRSTKLQVLTARIQLADGKYEDAVHSLTEICRNDDKNLEAIKILGTAYLERGQLREAKACMLRAFSLSKGEATALENLSKKFIEKGDLDEAHMTVIQVAEYFIEQGNFDEAVALYRDILVHNDHHVPSLETLAEVYNRADQMANAILTLEKLINHFLASNQKDMAIEKIRHLLQIDPNNMEWRGKLDNLEEGDLFGADESQEVAMPDADTGIHDIDDSGIEMVSAGDDVAIGSVDSMSLEPDDVASQVANHLTEADVFIKYGIMDQAMEHLQEVLKIDPFHFDANKKLKGIYFEKGLNDKGVDCLVSLITGLIQNQEFDRAYDFVDEVSEYNADLGRLQKQRLDHFSKSQGGFASPGPPAEPQAPTAQPPQSTPVADSDQEVVDFNQIKKQDDHQPEAVEWSLEFTPQNEEAPQPSGAAQDLGDMYHESEPPADFHQLDFESSPEPDDEEEADFLADDDVTDVTEINSFEADTSIPPKQAPQPPAQAAPPVQSPAPAKPAASAEPPKPERSLTSDLEEIDFFISVEAYEDAKALLTEAQNHFGEHPLIMERMQEVQAATSQQISTQRMAQTSPGKNDAPIGGLLDKDTETGFFDLAAELSEELFDDAEEVNDKTGQEEIQSVEELFEEFKKGVNEQIDSDDFETHYDLGIAYKEMGLLEEAISEFNIAMGDRSRVLECTTLVGNCLLELGRPEEAVPYFEKALNFDDNSEEETLALKYEMANLYQSMDNYDKALQYFREIQSVQADYRDLEDRIEALV
jgi:tetratricopeptide (TPR) repeat protein